MLPQEDSNQTDQSPLLYPLSNVEPDVKFRVSKSVSGKMQAENLRIPFDTRLSKPSTSTNSRKRRNIEEQISSLIAANNTRRPQSPTLEIMPDSTTSYEDAPIQTSTMNRQPAPKRRLLNVDSNTSSTADDSTAGQMMPPPSVNTSLAETGSEEVQPPLPSPSASPMASQDEDEGLSENESADGAKDSSYIKIPPTEEGVLATVERLIDFLSQRQKDALTWKLVSQTDRSRLSILNNTINGSLKRDLISTLPTEISHKILGYMDARSLIHAEQVSKNWFRIVNRSSGLWRVLIKEEKYIKTEEELSKELAAKDDLMRGWYRKGEHIPSSESDIPEECYKQIFKKRHIIHKRWMNPNYQPKRVTIKGHGSAVITCLQFDDDKIITGADDNVISVYDTNTGNLRRSLKGHTGGVWALKYYKNTLVSGATDRTVRIWNIKQGCCTHVFKGHTSTVRCLDILIPEVIGTSATGAPIIFPQEPLLITGSRDNSIHVWKLPLAEEDADIVEEPFDGVETNNPYFIRALRGHTASVRCISGRGNIVVTGSYDMSVRVWDLYTGRCKLVLRSHTDRVYSTVLDMERRRCISGSMDSTVKIWDLDDGHCIATLEGHSSLVGLLDLSETALVSAAADATLRVWDPETGDPRFQLKGHMGAITCFQHDDKKVVSGSERMLKLWDINTGKFVREMLPEITGATWQVRFDYRRCISAVQHRHGGARPDETLMEILDFGEPLYAEDDTDKPSLTGQHTIVERYDSSLEFDQDGDIDLEEEDGMFAF